MLNINWRSAAEHRYTKADPAAGLTWKYLHRVADYRRDFLIITRIRRPTDDELEAFAKRWGLRFPGRP